MTNKKTTSQIPAHLRADEDGVFRRIMGSSSVRSADEKSRVIEFVASDGSVDSYKTVLPVDKWDLRRYNKNGLVSYQHAAHGSDDPDDVIGKGEAWIENGQLIVRVTFEPGDLNAKAEKIFRKVLFGTLNGVSVGFLPTRAGHFGDKNKGENPDVYYYDGQELLEVSVVNIPANANAVKRSGPKTERQVYTPKTPAEKDAIEKALTVLDKQSKNEARRAEKDAREALILAAAHDALSNQKKFNP